TNKLRLLARDIIGDDLMLIYIKCSYEKSAQRDVKGLYAKAAAGEIKNFTGKDSSFEEPEETCADLIIDTEVDSPEGSLAMLYDFVIHKISYKPLAVEKKDSHI
ncbi:MAG: adenylyl-sulfate kinase, partial [Verrucomicrobiota bacterium]